MTKNITSQVIQNKTAPPMIIIVIMKDKTKVTTMSTKQDGSDCDPTNKALKKLNKYGCLQTRKINKKTTPTKRLIDIPPPPVSFSHPAILAVRQRT